MPGDLLNVPAYAELASRDPRMLDFVESLQAIGDTSEVYYVDAFLAAISAASFGFMVAAALAAVDPGSLAEIRAMYLASLLGETLGTGVDPYVSGLRRRT